jgi:hypothetical protein
MQIAMHDIVGMCLCKMTSAVILVQIGRKFGFREEELVDFFFKNFYFSEN